MSAGPAALILTACDKLAPAAPMGALEPGTRFVFASPEGHVEGSLLATSGPFLTVGLVWSPEMQSTRTYYRGLLPTAGTDNGRSYTIDIDLDQLAELFPLEPGKDLTLSGLYEGALSDVPLEAEIEVRVLGDSTYRLKDKSVPITRVQVRTTIGDSETSLVFEETVAFAPELGIILESVMTMGGKSWSMRVVEIRRKGERANPRNSVGTTLV